MHKKASNLFSEWALALRRSIGEPPPSSPAEVVAAAAVACEPTSPTPATTTPPTRAPTVAPATSPPPSSPAPALKKAASAASKSTGEQTKRQAETAEISRQMEADSFAAGAGTKGLLAAAATAAAKKMSEGPNSPKYEPPDIHPELTLAQIQQQLSEQLSGQCPIAKHRKKHNSNNVNIHEDIDGGI
jgi:hypothetical protein